jgi:excisionase family DNA binding protein
MKDHNHTKTGWDHRYVSQRDGAAYLGVSVSTLRRAIREGELPARRVGRQIRIEVQDLEALLRKVPTAKVGE